MFGQKWRAVVLTLTAGPSVLIPATVSFSATNVGWVLNPAFCGLSYEKSQLTGHLFAATDTSLVSMFGQIAPAVLRIGGNSVDTTCWAAYPTRRRSRQLKWMRSRASSRPSPPTGASFTASTCR